MMHNFNIKRMVYYNEIIISVEQMKIMGLFVSEIELNKIENKRFIMLPDSEGMDEYTLLFRQM